ncbi:hypothetical protein WA026_010555 [Henosepilachna vigintioctopunctata]|uniref:Uncharacterized protein n=1 Tax=Henosepilachna vigintioctopunctata TaxID=420089 RepID=A0AAW1V474_9CUCU
MSTNFLHLHYSPVFRKSLRVKKVTRMHNRSFLPPFIIVVSCAGLALTASVPSEVDNTKDSGITTVNEKFIWSFYNVAAIGTAIFVTSLVISVMLNLPFLAQILCYKFGILCIDPFASFEGYRSININDRHKRSLEYVEPILTTLTKAYEAYADDDLKKKFNGLKF